MKPGQQSQVALGSLAKGQKMSMSMHKTEWKKPCDYMTIKIQ